MIIIHLSQLILPRHKCRQWKQNCISIIKWNDRYIQQKVDYSYVKSKRNILNWIESSCLCPGHKSNYSNVQPGPSSSSSQTEASLIQIIVQLSVSLVTTPTPTIHHTAAVIIGCQQLSWSSFTVFHINSVYFGFYMKSKWQFVCREAEY